MKHEDMDDTEEHAAARPSPVQPTVLAHSLPPLKPGTTSQLHLVLAFVTTALQSEELF